MLEYTYKLDGGSLTSIKVDGEERMFELDPSIWNGQDNVIFPFVARLKNESYNHNGKEYQMNIHGLAKYCKFKLIERTPNSDTLLLESSEETLLQYPFEFKLIVNYKRFNNSLTVTYTVYNTGKNTMYFGIGGHPAIKVNYQNNDTKGNFILFDESTRIDYYSLEETGSHILDRKELGFVKEIEVDKNFFRRYKTLITESNNYHKITLKRKDNRKVIFTFNSKYLSIWSKPDNGDFVCIEPWDGLPDYMEPESEIKNKNGINTLEPGKSYIFSYTMTFED